jgi:hypothetical protein
MTFEQITGLALALLVMLIGTVGSVLPGIPGTPLLLIAAVGHRLYFGAAGAGNAVLIAITFLTLLSFTLDYAATMLGARKLGATWRGVVGAMLGAVIGIFFTLPGIILFPFLGALMFEMAGGREFDHAARAGMGAVLGLLCGAVGKLACCAAMITLFSTSVLARSF